MQPCFPLLSVFKENVHKRMQVGGLESEWAWSTVAFLNQPPDAALNFVEFQSSRYPSDSAHVYFIACCLCNSLSGWGVHAFPFFLKADSTRGSLRERYLKKGRPEDVSFT